MFDSKITREGSEMKPAAQYHHQPATDVIHAGDSASLREDERKESAPDSSVVNAERSHEKATNRLPPRLISQHEAAAYLGISYWTPRDLVFRKDLPSVRIGRRLLLDLRDLEAFIAHSKTAGS